MNTEDKKITPFELKVGGPNGIDNADVPVRWCITPEFVTQMEEDGIKDPHILLVAYKTTADYLSEAEMSRQIIPVAELMTHVRFTAAGPMQLFGWIINGTEGRQTLNENFMQKKRGEWNTTLLKLRYYDENRNYIDGKKELCPISDIYDAYIGTGRTVVIPTDVFAKEPTPALKWFINKWHQEPPKDGCHTKERMILAFGLKLIPLFVWSFLIVGYRVTIGSLLWACGWRHNVNWKYMWRPFEYVSSMVVTTEGDDGFCPNYIGWWLSNKFLWWRKINTSASSNYENTEENIIHVGFVPFTPIFPILFFSVSWDVTGIAGFAAIHTIEFLFWMLVITFTVDIVIETLVNIVIGGVPQISIWWKNFDNYMVNTNKWPNTIIWSSVASSILLLYLIVSYWMLFLIVGAVMATVAALVFGYIYLIKLASNFITLDEKHNDVTNIRELLCPNNMENLKAEYNYIPKEQRTAKLWFKNIKNHVCKPMQQ